MKKVGPLHSSAILHRHAQNPVLTAQDIPYPSALVYNAGVTKFRGRYVMVFRNDHGYDPLTKKAPYFQLGLAYSDDGLHWRVEPRPIRISADDPDVLGDMDARLNLSGGRCYVTYTQYTRHGYRATTAVTDDFQSFEVLDRAVPDNRNLVLFPSKFDGRYVRLERPFPIYSRLPQILFDIWISESPDLVFWGKSDLLLGVEDVPYANQRLGAGTPPVWTEWGWLLLFHAVDTDPERGKNGWEDRWPNRYTAGVLLLDLEDPRKIVAYSKAPLMVPEAPYEIEGGFRNNVVFPTGLVLEDSGEVKIYYGAADTVQCLATARLTDLVQFCLTS
jgi:beta-1,4-mannooligosaccharide/beta-1,4-mannosyl-N-acetylglucosamine phosphorylase